MSGVDSAEVKFSSGRIVIDYDADALSVKDLVAPSRTLVITPNERLLSAG